MSRHTPSHQPGADNLPLGLAQRSVWLDSHLAGSGGYLLGGWLRTAHDVDQDVLRASLQALVDQHDALRVRVDPLRPQQWLADNAALPLQCVQLEDCDDEAKADALFFEQIAGLFEQPMPFGDAPLFRILFLDCGAFRYLGWCFHHIIADSITVALALDYWRDAYLRATGQGGSAPTSTSMVDALQADAAYADSQEFSRDLKYWVRRFRELPPPLIEDLSPQPQSRAIARTATRRIDDTGALKAAAEALDMPPARALFGLFLQALARRYGRRDVVCGMAVHRRNRHTMRTLGMFAGVVPVRVTFEDWWSVADGLQAFNEQAVSDLRHHRLPLDVLRRELDGQDGGGARVFDVVMSYVPGVPAKDDDAKIVAGVVNSREACPISLHVTDDPATGQLTFRIAINPDFDDALDAQALADLLHETQAAFVADEWIGFEQLPRLAQCERAALEDLEQRVIEFESGRVEAHFLRSVAQRPDDTALVDVDGALTTYAELENATGQIAAHLKADGVSPGDVVGVRMARSADTVKALLGILRAGGVYLPLDPSYPAERLAYMVKDAGARHIIDSLDSMVADDLPAPQALASDAQASAADAYICYTSGTTGRPKGVAVSHGALLNLAWARADGHCQTGPGARVLAGISVGFDVSIEQLLVPLLTGATVVVAPDLKFVGPADFWALMRKQRITHFNSVPSFIATMLAEPPVGELALQTLLLGGEVLGGALAERIASALPGTKLVNVYGPTEACIEATAYVSTPDDSSVSGLPIGQPLANYIATVRDADGQRVGLGVAGELLLGGPSLASRYVNRPEETAERFVDDPCAPGSRLYRTGDRVRWRTDGQLEYLGRVDSQVKIRGFRVEPGEVEEVLARQPGVRDAAVVARAQASAAGGVDDVVLHAFVTGDVDEDALRQRLCSELPDYMRPAAIVVLDALPLTMNGKLDRGSLPSVSTTLVAGEYEAPRDATEEAVVLAMQSVLEEERGEALLHPIGRTDSFFALGGHSLSAVRLVSRLASTTGRTLGLRALFDAHTVAELAQALRTQGQAGAALPPITVADRDQPIALSFAQERLWFVERFAEPGAIAETLGFDLCGALDVGRLRRVFAVLFARHEGLRLQVALDGDAPVQRFAAPDALPFYQHDLRTVSRASQAEALDSRRRAPVDPSQGAFRVDLFDLGEVDGEPRQVLVLSLHHMVYDGVSLAILLAEFHALWADADARLPTVDVAYADVALWQRAALREGGLKASLERTVARLEQPPPPLALPSDRPRPEQPTHAATRLPVALTASQTAGIRALASAHQASVFMVLETALAVLLSREARVDDLMIGSVAAGRAHSQLEGVVGPLFNMIALRHRLDLEASFITALTAAREDALAAFEDQLVPFEVVLEHVVLHRDARHAVSPLFQVLFQLHTEAGTLLEPIELDGLAARPREWSKPQAMQDLTFDLFERGDAIEGTVTYSTELFDAPRIERLIERYVHLLDAIVADPQTAVGSLGLLPPSQSDTLRRFARAGRAVPPTAERLVPARMAAHAERTPAAPALACADAPFMDYATLLGGAARLARELEARGMGRGAVVAVATEPLGPGRPVDLMTALLAIWDCGATYLPINVDDPVARQRQIVEDAQVRLVVAPQALVSRVADVAVPVLSPDAPEVAASVAAHAPMPRVRATADDVAYLMYTSGSTGQPKGVMVSHRALASFCAAIADDLEQVLPAGQACVLSVAAPVFDAFFMDLAMSLVRGVPLVRLSPSRLAEPGYLARAASAHRGTYMDLTPSVWRAALASGWQPGSGFQCVTGGEAIEAELAAALMANGAQLYNSYGPTEATVVAVAGPLTDQDRAAAGQGTPLPIGRPLPGCQAYVLDAQCQPVAVGVPGELVLGGAQIANGYLGRPEQTAAAFIADPFADPFGGPPDQRLYRTGDLARWRDDGQLEYLGRIDDQVKIRGMRVELGEIESALLALPDIRAAAAAAIKDAHGQTTLVAYLVKGAPAAGDAPVAIIEDDTLTPAALRTALAEQLPEHMIPLACARLNRLPLTVNGKLDRGSLPSVSTTLVAGEYEAPRDATEEAVVLAMQSVLEEERGEALLHPIGRTDSFFALGGHSLSAVRLVSRLASTTGRTLGLRALFDAHTVAELAQALRTQGQAGAALPPITVADRDQPIALSFAQERLWFVDQLDSAASAAYRIDGAVRLDGPLDDVALEQALFTVVNRHESLRTRFAASEERHAVLDVAPDAQAAGFALGRVAAPGATEQDIAQHVATALAEPFDLAAGPLFRAQLMAIDDAAHVLVLSGHHAILDGWSVATLLHEVTTLYARANDPQAANVLSPLTIQYGDYAAWQRGALSADVLEHQLAWWRDTLADAPACVALPTDRPRPEAIDYRADSVPFHVPAAVVTALDALAAAQDATLFMVLEALFATYLARLGAGEDVVIGTAVAGRPKPELEPVVGYFANTVAIRNQVNLAHTVSAQVASAREAILAAFAYQDAPFDAVVNAVNPQRNLSHAPIVQVMLILQNVPGAADILALEGVAVTSVGQSSRHQASQFDLSLELGQAQDGLHGVMTFSTTLFDRATVEGLAMDFARLLEAAARAPESALHALPILHEPERDKVLQWADGGPRTQPAEPIGALFAGQVVEHAARPAVSAVADGQTLSYEALGQSVHQVAQVLRGAGVMPGDVVALCLSRTNALPACMLAVWKLGAAFVPVNIDDGPDRLRHAIADSGARLIIADAERADRLSELDAGQVIRIDAVACADTDAAPATPPDTWPRGDALAYIMYTSGSTGRPKGVAISHAALGAMRAAVLQDHALDGRDVLLCGFDSTFDVFVRDIALALSSGAHLVLLDPRDLLRPGRYGELAGQYGATWMALTPTVWRIALSDGWRPASGTRVEAGGEVMDATLAAMLGESGARVVNAYGPTEATAVSVQMCLPQEVAGDSVPIGRPLPGVHAYVVDAHLQAVPPGVPGELLLGGEQLAQGYLGRDDLTKEAFIANPFGVRADDRLYRTGDLVRWRRDGQLEFLGRLDAQVKIRGMRIELGEIEAVLCELQGVASAAVARQEDPGGVAGLAAFYVADCELEASWLRGELARRLPKHMIPRAFARVAQLPLTPSGKINRRALPQMLDSVARAPYVAPKTATEHAVVAAFEDLLFADSAPHEPVGLGDNFFALGGHSMLAVQLLAALERVTGVSLPLRTVFDAPDVAALAAALDQVGQNGGLAADDSIDAAKADIAQAQTLPAPPHGEPPALGAARCVLMTGATGFIGRYFVRELLERTGARIICLARGHDADAERARILAAVDAIESVTLEPHQAERIEVVQGDIGAPNLGLDADRFETLAADVDLILHNAAVVHAIKAYEGLRQANTLSVLHLLRLMAAGRPKSLVFISTLGVLQAPIDSLSEGFDTEALTPAADSGYNLSKWAAERLVISARKRGYRAAIMRPGLVIGDSRSGYYQTNDIGNGYALLFADVGAIPDAISSFALPWINVDRAVQQMLDLAALDGESAGLFHIFEHGALPGEILAGAMQSAGFSVDILPVKQWLSRALALLAAQPEHPAAWLLPRLRAQADELADVADADIPTVPARDLLARYAPPPWPDAARARQPQRPADGLLKTMQWLTEQSAPRQERGR